MQRYKHFVVARHDNDGNIAAWVVNRTLGGAHPSEELAIYRISPGDDTYEMLKLANARRDTFAAVHAHEYAAARLAAERAEAKTDNITGSRRAPRHVIEKLEAALRYAEMGAHTHFGLEKVAEVARMVDTRTAEVTTSPVTRNEYIKAQTESWRRAWLIPAIRDVLQWARDE